MLKGFKKGQFSKPGASRKNKLRRQILRSKKMSKNDKLLEKEDHIYVPEKV